MNESLQFLDLGSDDPTVVGLAIHGKLTGADMAQLIEVLERIRADGHKARLYVDLTDYQGYELPVVREKLAHMGTLWHGIERCAYLVDKGWMTTAIGLVDAVTPMHLRAFTSDHAAEARAWLMAQE